MIKKIYKVIDNDFNRHSAKRLINFYFEIPPSYCHVEEIPINQFNGLKACLYKNYQEWLEEDRLLRSV